MNRSIGWLAAVACGASMLASGASAGPLQIDRTRVAELTIDGPAARPSNTTSIGLSGRLTALPGPNAGLALQTIAVSRDDEIVATATTGSDGSWAADVSVNSDAHAFRASWSYGAGQVTSSDHFTYVPNPIEVSVELDRTRSSAAVVDQVGGTVQATAADGTRFALTIPPGAVTGPEEVVMTPVVVEGMPFDAAPHAVEFEPEGLVLLAEARLHVVPPEAEDHTLSLAYAWHETGERFHFVPMDVSRQISVAVHHFSGAGVVSATDQEFAQAAVRYAFDAADFIRARTALVLARERQRQLLGESGDDDVLESSLRSHSASMYRQVVRPILHAATVDDAHLEAALIEALQWRRDVEVHGFEEEFAAETNEMVGLLNQVLVFGYEQSYSRCVSQKDIASMSRMVAVYVAGRGFPIAGVNPLFNARRLRACARFELDFDAVASIDYGWAVGVSRVRVASLPIEMGTPAGGGCGEACIGDLSYESFTLTADHFCGWTHAIHEPFAVDHIRMSANLKQSATPESGLTLALASFGTVEETALFCPPDIDQFAVAGFRNYSVAMTALHAVSGSGVTVIADFDALPGGVMEKTFVRSTVVGPLVVGERTVVALRHSPHD